MKKLLFLFILALFTINAYSQSLGLRHLWFTGPPHSYYLGYPALSPPLRWAYESNPPVLYDGLSGNHGKPLQSPNGFYVHYRHDSKFLWKNYFIPSPLMYMGVPDGQNPAFPWYVEPNIPPSGQLVANIGPTIIIEFHLGKALATPIETPFGDQYVDQGYYPYKMFQLLLPWHRLKFDIEDQYLFGVRVYASTWKFTNANFGNIGNEWIDGGGFSTNPMRPLEFNDEEFSTGRSPWLQDGDMFVCQAKVTYLFPYNPSTLLSQGNYTDFYEVTFWSNPIFLEVEANG
jgi:hypothetical protein